VGGGHLFHIERILGIWLAIGTPTKALALIRAHVGCQSKEVTDDGTPATNREAICIHDERLLGPVGPG